MSTAIEWTEETWNPTTGCDRISAGCDNCYALTLAKRLKGMGSAKYQTDGDPRTSGPGFGLATHADALTIPLKWRKPRTVFVNSMSDLFHARVPTAYVARVFAVMAATPQHTYQILTKRPERMLRLVGEEIDGGVVLLDAAYAAGFESVATALYEAEWPLSNVWLGTSIESDQHAGRADALRKTNAAVRFISAEPLLGPLPSLDLTGIDWLIAGGESGPNARPMHPDWVRDLRDRCQAAGTAFFFKQWGNWVPPSEMPEDTFMSWDVEHGTSAYDRDQPWRVGKKAAGRELDGRTWDQYPTSAEQAAA
ncbi:phage Gp37/Gp68 family protein [Micromonospora sp. MED01]|uniref:phage Gp37/Gp68 family protein n=1 Tax=Micromonospora alfalfae TaxID=2911212 RepID=UPI001EE95C2C|nr:phage Gp37/Gp68 family protein [Micromonospora alfalfae]MCG5460821.1 phage Gp37/Gp68 family protein [Micromonospora alfalfae]